MITHPFPDTEPEVTVASRPEAKLTEVLRTDAGGFFVPLAVGGEAKWSFYDWPERKLTTVSYTRIPGTVLYRGEELLEVIDRVIWPPEETNESTRWLYRIKNETMTWVLREIRWPGRPVKISDADVTPEPLRVKVGQTWVDYEIYRCGDEIGDEGPARAIIDGPYEVVVPAGRMLCLKKTHWGLGVDGRGVTLAELYIAENGRSIYWRRFNGPALHSYADLGAAGVPEREHDGVVWRLWYECLPDIAL